MKVIQNTDNQQLWAYIYFFFIQWKPTCVSLVFSHLLGDETFNDVFKDFTHMASENPEKLKRKENQDQ